MAVYAIGDIQGCYDELCALLDQLRFDPAADTLWFTGDLVNRGPRSLETLRLVRDLGERAVTVLGNHDLHLVAVALDPGHRMKSQDTLGPILKAKDRDELLAWLRNRPLMHHDTVLGWTLVHAGLPPQWDLATARACAAEVENVLRSEEYPAFITHMYGNEPHRWSPDLSGWPRLRYIVNCFTRLRFVHGDGRLDFAHKGAPQGEGELLPWFRIPERRSRDARIAFGHWSTLGLYMGEGVCALDTGCLWGGALTAVRLDIPELSVSSLPCRGFRRPGSN